MPRGTHNTSLLLQDHNLHAFLGPHGQGRASRRLTSRRIRQHHRLLSHEGFVLRHGPHLLPSLWGPPLVGSQPDVHQDRHPPPYLHHPHHFPLAQRRALIPPTRPGSRHHQDRQELPHLLTTRVAHSCNPCTSPDTTANSGLELTQHHYRHVRIGTAFARNIFSRHVFGLKSEGYCIGVIYLLPQLEHWLVDLPVFLQSRYQAVGTRRHPRLRLPWLEAVAQSGFAERLPGLSGVVVVRDYSLSQRLAS